MNRSRTDTTSTKRADPSEDRQVETSPFRLEPPRRKVQVPQLVIAVFLVAVSALAAVVLFSQVAARDPQLALAERYPKSPARRVPCAIRLQPVSGARIGR